MSAASVSRWRAREREQGEPRAKAMAGDRRSHRIEKHAELILSLYEATPDITLEELRAALAERGVLVGYGGLWRFFDRHGITVKKKTAHAAEQQRPDVLKRREAWFVEQLDLDPARLVFIDETWASTNMARRYGRAPRGQRLRAAVPHGHVWTPPRVQEESLVTGAARGRVLPCVRPLLRRGHMPRARMGVRGSGPHHWSALEALPVRLVLPTPPHRRCAIPVLRPPHTFDSLTPALLLTQRRPELDRSRPWRSAPRRRGPSCWPAPR